MRNFATSLSFLCLFLVSVSANAASSFNDYKPGMVESALKKGETVFIDFYATWCGTCRTQERVINALVEKNPEYKDAMTFIKVNWDEFGNSEIARKYNIPRRSTLIVLRGDEVLGKVVAQTASGTIKKLMDKGL
ncbi:MAG: thioredoxin family protein [Pseudomonadota bacterium]